MQQPQTPPDPAFDASKLVYVALSLGLWWMKLTYGLWRRTRYLEEALLREQQQNIERQNEMQKRLLEAFLREPTPTLRTLVADIETEYETKP